MTAVFSGDSALRAQGYLNGVKTLPLERLSPITLQAISKTLRRCAEHKLIAASAMRQVGGNGGLFDADAMELLAASCVFHALSKRGACT